MVDIPGVLEYHSSTHSFNYCPEVIQTERIKFEDRNEIQQDFSKEYLNKQKEESDKVPIIGTVTITNECNMGCSFCYAHKNEQLGKINLDYLIRLKEKLPKECFDHLILSGGEPLLYFDTVKSVRKLYSKVVIYTNGSLLTEDIIKWCIDTKTWLYITLDFDIPDFIGHHSSPVRDLLEKYIYKYPKLLDIISFGTVLPIEELINLPKLRQQQKPFESGIWRLYNFLDPKDKNYVVSSEGFDLEMSNIETGSISLQESIFFRYLNYVQTASTNEYNYSCCGNSLALTPSGNLTICNELSSLPESRLKNTKVWSIDSLDLEEVKQEQLRVGKYGIKSFCGSCIMKYFCSGLCWQKKGNLKHQCQMARFGIAYSMYYKFNYLNTNSILNPNTKLSEILRDR